MSRPFVASTNRYAKLYIAFDPDFVDTVDDDVLDAISSQFLFQLGFLLILPIPLLLAVEQVTKQRDKLFSTWDKMQ